MLVKTKGIVFRSVKYKETSLILDIYTRELGLRSYIISGVRKKNAKTSAAILQVMNIVEMIVYEREGRQLNRIKEIKPAYSYEKLTFNIGKSSVGIFLLEIIRKSIKEREHNQALFDFLMDAYILLDLTKESISSFHIVFLVRLSAILGFIPENNFSELNNFFDLREGHFLANAPFHKDYISFPESKLLHECLSFSLEKSHTFKVDATQRIILLEQLILYYKIHLDDHSQIKSLDIFKDIFR